MEEKSNLDKIKDRIGLYNQVFKSELGAEVLKDLEKYAFMKNTTFSGNDPYSMAFKEGFRCFYLHIINTMELKIEDLEELKKKQDDKVVEINP